MNKKLLLAAVATVSVLALAGCSSTSTSSDNTTASNSNSASSTTNSSGTLSNTNSSTTTATSTSATGDATKGKAVFATSCAACHSTSSDKLMGPGLQGETKKAKLENGKDMNDQNLTDWIKNGGSGKIGMMPPQSSLNDQQLADVVAYVKTL